MINAYGLLGIFALLSAVSPLSARAQTTPPVVISEIAWAGSEASTADEWVELANLTSSPVNLTGWTILGGAGSGKSLIIPDGAIIPAQGTLVLANYGLGDPKTTLLKAPDVVTTAVSINNSSLSLELKTADGEIIDSYIHSGTPDVGSTSPFASAERNLSTLGWQTASISINLSSPAQFGTPGTALFPVPASEPVVAVEETPVEESVVDESTSEAETLNEAGESGVSNSALPIDIVEEPTEGAPGGETSSEVPVVDPCLICPVQTITVTQIVPVEPAQTSAPTSSTETSGVTIPVLSETEIEATPTHYPAQSVLINEFVSDPADGVEWIELYNTTDSAIDLTGWSEEDGSSSKTILPDTTLPAHGYFVLQNPKGKLNNDGDSIFVYDATGATIDAVAYDKDTAPDKGESLSRFSDTWAKTTPTPSNENTKPYATTLNTSSTEDTPETDSGETPGNDDSSGTPSVIRVVSDDAVAASVAPSQPPSLKEGGATPEKEGEGASQSVPVIDAAEINNYEAETLVTIEGVLVAVPGDFGKQLAYVDGLEIYFNKADWPKLKSMTRVRVTGTVDPKDEYTRLKIKKRSDITVISDDAVAPDELTELGDARHGLLMSAVGTVVDVSGKNLTLGLENGELITVQSVKTKSIDFSRFLYGDRVAVTGVVRVKEGVFTLSIMDASGLTALQESTTNNSSGAGSTTSSQPPPSQGGAIPDPKRTAPKIKAQAHSAPWVGGGLLTTSLGALGYWFARAKGITLPLISPA